MQQRAKVTRSRGRSIPAVSHPIFTHFLIDSDFE